MRQAGRRFFADEHGSALVEGTVLLLVFLVFVFGSVDFLMAAYQWNAAAKAVQLGARIAAVSSPVSSDLATMTGLEGGGTPGEDEMPSFTRVCNGATATCSGGTFSAAALDSIVYGRGRTTCGSSSNIYARGMCNAFPNRITPANVVITYTHTQPGLGYAGRPGGPVPTITLSLQNITFRFYFLGGLMGFGDITIPGLTTTITGEDLSSNAPT